MSHFKGKNIVITGGSRGIGHAIAVKLAADGANIALLSKTDTPHPKLEGTIHTVAEDIIQAGGQALPIKTDIRFEQEVNDAIGEVVSTFGGIDILINNASAISLTKCLDTKMKTYDLMQSVNARGTFLCSQSCLPHLLKSDNPHILTISPPLNMKNKWFKDHTAYTISKYGMSMTTLGLSAELEASGVAVNSLWPRTTIATAAIKYNFSEEILQASRKPEIMADSAYWVLSRPSRELTGQFLIDESVLRKIGVEDFDKYQVTPGKALFSDLYID
jgi:citronellol/citronellal dehydrogenase